MHEMLNGRTYVSKISYSSSTGKLRNEGLMSFIENSFWACLVRSCLDNILHVNLYLTNVYK